MADDNWYYTMGGQQQGPSPLAHLKHWLANGQLQPGELVWREGMAAWTPAGQVPELMSAAPAAAPAAQPPSGDWYYAHGGQQQGPVPGSTLAQYLSAGQLAADSSVWREGMGNWQPANQVTELQPFTRSGAAAAGFQQAGAGGYPQQAGFQHVGYAQAAANQSQVSKAKTSMICGIIGLLCFGIILGPIAIVFASLAFSEMKRSGSAEGKGMATAGMVMGIIAIVFFFVILAVNLGMN